MFSAQYSSRTTDDKADTTGGSGLFGENLREWFGWRFGFDRRIGDVEAGEESGGENGLGCRDGFGGEEGASWYRHCVAGRCSEKEKGRKREMLGLWSFVLQKRGKG